MKLAKLSTKPMAASDSKNKTRVVLEITYDQYELEISYNQELND